MRVSLQSHWIRTSFIAALALAPFLGDSPPARANGFECLDEYWSTKEVLPAYAGKPNLRSAILPLKIYVVRDDNGQGGATAAEVDSLIAHTRADYAARGIYFDIVEDEILCSECLTDSSTVNLYDLITNDVTTLSAAVLLAPDTAPFSFGGSLGIPGLEVVVGIKRGAFESGVLSHEIGHNLGLYHTFELYCGIPGTTSNCDECGDLVCDTAADTYGGTMRNYVDPNTCEFDPEKYAPPTPSGDPTNIMSYSWPSCMTFISDGQTDRMLYFIENHTTFSSLQIRAVSARYENKTSDTNLDYDGTPYSSVAVDYNADDLKDLFISMRDDFGSLQKQLYLTFDEIPQFIDRTEIDIAEGDLPQVGLRGVVVADYDNDGRVDLFAAADSIPRLYHNNNGTFADSAATLGLAALADSSYAAAWGDFDRDGQVDLYVCRGVGGGSDPTVANLSAVRGRLLRNDLRKSGTFVDCSDSLGGAANTMGASVAASWADVDSDGDLDLFVGDLRDASGAAASRFYINNGLGGMTESFASSFSGLGIENVNSVVWADMNNDGHLDLVLGSAAGPPAVYINDGTGDFDNQEPLLADLANGANGVRPLDSDLDGTQDLLAIPRDAADHRRLFWNQVIEGERVFLDQSWTAGFADSTGRIDGLVVADFNGDGDADVYFGRPVSTDDVFYRAKWTTGDHPLSDWVGVRLVAGGGNNGSAIGTNVRFYIGSSFQQVQVVDGGSGKGGQADNVLVCGLGGMTGAVSAEIRWPGGYVQTAALTRGEVNVIADETVPGVPSSVGGVYTALPEGQAELTFTWETAHSCKPSLDKVTITDRPRQPSQCPMGTVVLTPSSDNVLHEVSAKAGGGYLHTLTWPLECRAPCSYNFTIESATDSTHKSQMAQPEQISMPVCISQ